MKIESVCAKRVNSLNRRIQRLALFPFGDTEKQIRAVLLATDTKRQTERMQNLSQRLKKGLTDEEIRILDMSASGLSVTDIAERTGMTKHTAYRRHKTALTAAENVLFLLGYDAQTMSEKFGLVAA